MLCSEDFDAERQAKIEAEPPGDTQLGWIAKTRQKLDFKNSWNWLVMLIAYSCNSLTDFDYDANVITGNGNHVYQLTLSRKFVKPHQVNLFFGEL